jgi:serine/threonine protein kinase
MSWSLVHKLAHGAFGCVKYAQLIDRSRTRSNWPEYVVKVVSTEKIKELGLTASVQREVTVLRILLHPGIARLASSFRFREGGYQHELPLPDTLG